MTDLEFNRNFWIIADVPLFGRRPISYPLFCSLVGSKINQIISKLEQNNNKKLIVKPFHHETYIIYRR